MLKVLKTDINRVFLSKNFYFAIVGMLLVNMLNIWDELMLHSPYWQSTSVLYFFVYRHGLGGISIISLVLIVMPNALSFSEDFNTGFVKNLYVREGRTKYALSKIITTFAATFIAVFVSYVIFVLTLNTFMPLFPAADRMEHFRNQIFLFSLAEQNSLIFFALHMILECVSSAFLSLLTLAVSLVVKNKYVLYCIPVMAAKVCEFLGGALRVPRFLNWNLFRSRALIGVFENEATDYVVTVMYFVIASVIVGTIFLLGVRKRVEYA